MSSHARQETSDSESRGPLSDIAFTDEVRAVAQLGLTFSTDSYDRERYARLLRLAADRYSALSGVPASGIEDAFRREIGYVTPKLGVDAAVFSGKGELLLIRRRDSGRWALPGGWAEVGRTPEASIEAEVTEETGLFVVARHILDVSHRLASTASPHASVHLLYFCEVLSGTPRPSAEASEVGYFDIDDVHAWHDGHRERALVSRDLFIAGSVNGEAGEPRLRKFL